MRASAVFLFEILGSKMARTRGIPALSWAVPVLLIGLCAALGALQYRWIDEASRAERDRLRAGLKAALMRFSTALNAELTTAVAYFLPEGGPGNRLLTPDDLKASFQRWQESATRADLFARIGLVSVRGTQLVLWMLDPRTGEVKEADWPEAWSAWRSRLEMRLAPMLEPPSVRRREPPRPPSPEEALLFEVSAFGRGPVETRRFAWLIFELNADCLRGSLLPELLERHLGEAVHDYQMEAVYRADPERVFWRNTKEPLRGAPDAGLAIVDLHYDELFRRFGPPGARGPVKPRMASADMGRLWLAVRHRAGSLEAVVARTRMRNLAVTGAILLLMAAALAALLVSTRRAQRLAAMQMDFVTGVSHELRTPLTVIRTAAYNLRGRLAQNPAAVEKYGALIQKESERLTEIVEQVLDFARSRCERAGRPLEPVPIREAVEEAVSACQPLIESSGCRVETAIPDVLPPALAEPRSLARAIQNLLANAVKYGGGWVRVSAAARGDRIEICVADRGPGIPASELPHVFEPFFRGRRAIDEQIHGTGLGLALVRSAIESCGGEVDVRSRPGELTEFFVRLRTAPHRAAEPQPVPSGEEAG